MNHPLMLDIQHISKSTADVEYHPLKPFIFSDTRILFLGSFPPQRKRWCMDFFYPNFINDHWRIQGIVFYDDIDYFVDKQRNIFKVNEIIEHCRQHKIGFYDTATAVRRLADNASDKFLEVVQPTDIKTLVKIAPDLKAIVTTGTKATETIVNSLSIPASPSVGEFVSIPILPGVFLYRLPSSSRAYPLNVYKKAEAYKLMFQQLNI